jgi:two-component system KDP operon response regulator KdpE
MARGRRILLLEPDETLARVLTVLLQHFGYQPEPVRDLIDALRVISNDPPAVIVADVGLPDRPGVTLVRALKADPGVRGVPVIGIEAEGALAEGAALDAGCAACLRSPLDTHRLLELLEIAVEG